MIVLPLWLQGFLRALALYVINIRQKGQRCSPGDLVSLKRHMFTICVLDALLFVLCFIEMPDYYLFKTYLTDVVMELLQSVTVV